LYKIIIIVNLSLTWKTELPVKCIYYYTTSFQKDYLYNHKYMETLIFLFKNMQKPQSSFPRLVEEKLLS